MLKINIIMETEKSIFFWKENNKYGFLSNFYTSHFVDANNVKYTCIEQYFIANKCLLFDESNTKLYNKIMNTTLPYTIKKIGRQVANFDQSLWDKEKYEIMKTGIRYKFLQNIKLKKKLMQTENKRLYEASKYDKIWGIGMTQQEAKEIEDANFPGENLLGKALMEVREEFKQTN